VGNDLPAADNLADPFKQVFLPVSGRSVYVGVTLGLFQLFGTGAVARVLGMDVSTTPSSIE
jgi:hypothetical protein